MLAVLAITLAIALAVGLAIEITHIRIPATRGSSDSSPPAADPPAAGLAINATCTADIDCVSDLCLASRSRSALTGTVSDKGTYTRSKQCESGVCDGSSDICRLGAGRTCDTTLGDFCASFKCSFNGTCSQIDRITIVVASLEHHWSTTVIGFYCRTSVRPDIGVSGVSGRVHLHMLQSEDV